MVSSRKRFALIGAAGYIAPRHMAAVAQLGHEIVAALDPHDSVGILDQYHPEAAFFTVFERFDRFLSKEIQAGRPIDYLIVCSPNHLHDAHCRFGLRIGADVICEKPIVLNERNLLALQQIEADSENTIWCILQARLHPEIVRLKKALKLQDGEKSDVEINYVTPRGQWYDYSWKGDPSKSGGIETNIGIHLLDLICFLFGKVKESRQIQATNRSYSGKLSLERAEVRFHVSVNPATGQRKAKRIFQVNNESYDLSSAFDDLHLLSYEKILNKQGFRLSDALPSIALAEQLREARTS